MLYLGGAEPIRIQCAFVDTPEVERINEFIAAQQSYNMPFELPEPDTPEADFGDGGDKDVDMAHLDPLFEDAARLIVINQSGSTYWLQPCWQTDGPVGEGRCCGCRYGLQTPRGNDPR